MPPRLRAAAMALWGVRIRQVHRRGVPRAVPWVWLLAMGARRCQFCAMVMVMVAVVVLFVRSGWRLALAGSFRREGAEGGHSFFRKAGLLLCYARWMHQRGEGDTYVTWKQSKSHFDWLIIKIFKYIIGHARHVFYKCTAGREIEQTIL